MPTLRSRRRAIITIATAFPPNSQAKYSMANAQPTAQPSTPMERPPLYWVTVILFSSTFLLAISAVPYYGFTQGYDWFEWTVFGLMLAFCGLSITGGYHRLWSHRAYEASPAVRLFFAFWGACALQNTILIWCSNHRRHHRYVDSNEKDPYSINRGFWFAHMGWMLRKYKSGDYDPSNIKDLQRDEIVMFQDRHYLKLAFASNFMVPAVLGWLNGDIIGMLLLAGVLRLVISHHVTFFINSLCHMWGKRPYTEKNTAKDNFLLALVTYGEGYHNFHHCFQTDFRNGIRWWQYDPTKWLIRSLSWVGLTRNLRRVPEFKIQEALVQMQFEKARRRLEDSNCPEMAKLRKALDHEYQQFLATLDQWSKLRSQWLQEKRRLLEAKKLELQEKLNLSHVRQQLKEIEQNLVLQYQRLQSMNLSVAS